MVVATGTMLFGLIVAALLAPAVITVVALFLGALAGLATVLAEIVEWAAPHRSSRASVR